MSLDPDSAEHVARQAERASLDPANVITNAAASIAGAGDNTAETGAEGGTEAADHADNSQLDGGATEFAGLPPELRQLLGLDGAAEDQRPVQEVSKDELLQLIDGAGQAIDALTDKVETYLRTQADQMNHDWRAAGRPRPYAPGDALEKANAPGWLGVSTVSLATGLMQLRRAVEQPDRF